MNDRGELERERLIMNEIHHVKRPACVCFASLIAVIGVYSGARGRGQGQQLHLFVLHVTVMMNLIWEGVTFLFTSFTHRRSPPSPSYRPFPAAFYALSPTVSILCSEICPATGTACTSFPAFPLPSEPTQVSSKDPRGIPYPFCITLSRSRWRTTLSVP